MGEIEKARELISSLEFVTHELQEEELARIRNGLLLTLHAEKEQNKELVLHGSHWFSGKRPKLLKVAATLLMVPLFSFGLYFLISKSGVRIDGVAEAASSVVEERENPTGQKSVLFLDDGTKVWLNAASKISYAKDFEDQETRDVYLEGEAFFDVAHDKEKPFVVHTTSLKIKVLGTSFNVKSYSEEKTIETTLVQGKVRIEQSGVQGNHIGDIELKPNQRAVFDKQSNVIKVKEVVAENSGSWKVERMVFDGVSIDNVILQMERWFNVRIHVENKGDLDCKLTASIEEESLEEVLKLIEATHDIHYRIEGRDVYLEGRLCSTMQP